MSNRVKDFLNLNTKWRVLVNGENGSTVYFYRLDFLKIHFLTSNLANYKNLLNNWISEYIIREADFSGEEENDVIVIDQ